METIVNRVAESDIVVFNLEDLWDERDVAELDVAPFLLEGLVLREKDFREKVAAYDWGEFEGKHVAVYCSTDAIVATWAYMLLASKLSNIAESVAFGRREDLLREYFTRALEAVQWEEYRDRPIVIKGCASRIVPPGAYLAATTKLKEVAGKVMYGEPCSSVPIWRKPKSQPAAARAAVSVSLPKSP